MKFRLFAATVVVAFCALAQTATQSSDAHEQKLTDIRRLMSLTGGDKMANQMLDQMGASLRASGGANSEKFFEEFRQEFDLKKVFELQVASYDKYLSAEDVRAIVQFYESPVGKRMIDALPQIMGDMMKQSMEMSQEITQKLMKKHQDDH